MYFYNRLKASEVRGLVQQRIKLIAWYEPTYENPREFYIQFVFAKLGA